ncbi:MAG: 1-acyl-sn-glycerol-3-phosphate acyltransferase [Bacteroidales bacterium]|nr:1-acyl-sn-glycerol-3-phosphate acyltransferase [Bacteroidales bacterium]MBN2698806.1 1-acyl-sn-glycerol-3-phosphate acyltransferase [Bacteroidales bacterium]
MIIKARHHWFYYPFFRLYSRRMPGFDFGRITVHSDVADRGLPLLMLSSHVTWWDGFLGEYINHQLFKRKYHVMMLEEQLKKRMFLNKTGAYSIKKGSRSALESLQYTSELLKDRRNMVLLFPQGKIHSMFDYPVVFEKGWFRIFRDLENPVQVLFVIILIDYFSSRKPWLNLYLYDYDYPGRTLEEMNRDFNHYLLESIGNQKSMA